MARKYKPNVLSDKRILVVDDNEEYINITRIMLENEGHTVMFAKNGIEALELCKKEYFDLILVDFYMPKMTGEQMIKKLREFNPYIQVILQTGYANEQPPRELIRNLDIQGYYNKIDGPEQLLLWVDVGLKAADSIQRLYKSRQSLNYILNVTPDLHKLQPLGDLLQGILMQISGLLGIRNSFLAILPCDKKEKADQEVTEGFVAIVDEESDLIKGENSIAR